MGGRIVLASLLGASFGFLIGVCLWPIVAAVFHINVGEVFTWRLWLVGGVAGLIVFILNLSGRLLPPQT